MSSLLSTILLNFRLEVEASLEEIGDIYAEFPIEKFLSFIDDAAEQLLRHEGLIGDTD
jgi:hypothetical protein